MEERASADADVATTTVGLTESMILTFVVDVYMRMPNLLDSKCLIKFLKFKMLYFSDKSFILEDPL